MSANAAVPAPTLAASNEHALVRLLRSYMGAYRGALVAVVVLQLAASIAMLYLPNLNADIIDNGVAKADSTYILKVGGWMLVVTVLQIVCTCGALYFGARASLGAGRDIRHDLLHRINRFSAREVGTFGAPSLITRTTNDVQQVQMLGVMSCTILVSAPIMCVGGIVMGIHVGGRLAWVLAVVVPLLGGGMAFLINRMIPSFRAMQRRIDAVNRILREQITGIRVVRAFVREDYERRRFAGANDELTDAALRVGRLMALMFPLVMGLANFAIVAIVWVGAHLISSGSVGIGALTAMIAYVMQIMMSVMMASFLAMMAPRAAVCAERICEVLGTESTVHPPDSPKPFTAPTGTVEMKDAQFRYPGADQCVLDGITFTAGPGSTTAIVGSTGSGKSTLLALIPRLIDVSSGAVRVGGTDVRELDPAALRAQIGFVPQRPYLFSGTVASNLLVGKGDATEDEMWTALRIAQASDFVAEMPGLQTPIGQGGTTVSGGQRQRLAIARALIANPSVYLFDDSFSALDLATDAKLRAALVPATRQACVIIVAQRISTILDADQIVVLDRGRVAGLGTHDELLATCQTYREIVESQMSVEGAR